MGRILISAVTKRSGINTGGIGWCTDFRQRHLAEGCGCLSPGPWLCGSEGGGVLRATRRVAAKAGLGVGSAASWPGTERFLRGLGAQKVPVSCSQLCSHCLGILNNFIFRKLKVESVARMCAYQEVKDMS